MGPVVVTESATAMAPVRSRDGRYAAARTSTTGIERVAFAGFAAGIAICLLLTVHLHSSLDTYIHHVDETAVHQSSPLRTQQQEVQDKQHGTPTTEDEGISACLLVNDENPRLPEWISYHYQTLPLRALIIAIDPASRSLPNDIILQWLDELPNVYIQPWSEKRYVVWSFLCCYLFMLVTLTSLIASLTDTYL